MIFVDFGLPLPKTGQMSSQFSDFGMHFTNSHKTVESRFYKVVFISRTGFLGICVVSQIPANFVSFRSAHACLYLKNRSSDVPRGSWLLVRFRTFPNFAFANFEIEVISL
jgi:hypothetical protein